MQTINPVVAGAGRIRRWTVTIQHPASKETGHKEEAANYWILSFMEEARGLNYPGDFSSTHARRQTLTRLLKATVALDLGRIFWSLVWTERTAI